ncbi:aminoglycoside phosphotransferase family protein [Planosporangium flavigriseum]|uniref:Aminoglycoside phosphotransferase n=1 Tax=Planosporangium flavigriseum TaxID=373681 RepID=A0A8J3LQB4_9ACTN|nr:aminoglycoside phosphotransferase family protein [Planosporangium flavigriseum]NJC66241.1 aminoglycoside phosphotransferase family protein [Planosporangium flavigriseum]GIG74698.1 aminoglycoside phosphotransferase [Planosporangium flavigriseum]
MTARQALELTAKQAGFDSTDAELIRAGENTLFRLVDGVVARVGRPGQEAAANKEVQVSRWLSTAGIAVVEAMLEITQPIVVDGVPVTFWRELPLHREGSVDQVADVLRQLHALQPPPYLDLSPLAPFVRLDERIAEASVFSDADRQWLHEHLHRLQQRYAELPAGLPRGAVHGDAWGGNIVATAGGPVVLDLERFAYGPPEWDLVSIAVDHFTFGSLSDAEWAEFCHRYGYDVTDWAGYTVLRDARELRKVTFAAQMAAQYPHLRKQAQYRLACIRGERGSRPWNWEPVP